MLPFCQRQQFPTVATLDRTARRIVSDIVSAGGYAEFSVVLQILLGSYNGRDILYLLSCL